LKLCAVTAASDRFSTGVSGNWQGEAATKDGPLQLAVHIWPFQNGKQLVGLAEVLNRNDEILFINPSSTSRTCISRYAGAQSASTVSSTRKGRSSKVTGNNLGASAPLVLKRVEKSK
jgi:hypothetical protein